MFKNVGINPNIDTRLLILLLLTIIACNSKKQDSTDAGGNTNGVTASLAEHDWIKYISINRDGYIDTVYRELVSLNLVDSVYEISYKTRDGLDGEVFTETHRLPIGKSTFEEYVKLLEVKSIRYGGKEYKVYKFFYDEPDASDEEMLYFFEPTYGFIIDKSAWWGNYNRLMDFGDKKDDMTAFFLGEMVLFDGDFFLKY